MGGGFVAHIIGAYGGFRASMRQAMARKTGEENLLALVAFGSFVVFLSFLPTLFATDLRDNPDQSIAGGVIMWFFVVMFFLPLVLYGVAALSHFIARRFGATGPYFNARHALFWALAVLSPVLILKAMLGSIVLQYGGANAGVLGGVLNLGLFAIIVWIWASMLAEAEGFRSTIKVASGIISVFAVIYALLFGISLL